MILFLYLFIGCCCLIGLIITVQKPPLPPVTQRTRHRIHVAQEKKEWDR